MILRPAEPADLGAIRNIRMALPMPVASSTTTGGFLLGCSDEEYLEHIRHGECLVCSQDHEVIGFGILIEDNAFRHGSIWPRRNQASWEEPVRKWESLRMGYYDQLAFLPGKGRWAVGLAWAQVRSAFRQGAEAIFATTVYSPVRNLAAVPFILAAGGRRVGRIDEHYPTVGPLVSDIYVLEAGHFYEREASLTDYPFLERVSRVLT